MGAICNQVENKTFGTLEQVIETSTKSQFEPVQLQGIPYLAHKIEEICKNNLEFQNFTEGRQLFKHKVKDLYFLGDWTEAGYQQGKGIIYSVDEYIYYGNIDTVPSGTGVLESLVDQYIYEGEFNYGRIEGNGKVNSINNLFSFQGTFNSKSEPVSGNFIINNLQNEQKSYTIFLNNYPENKARLVYKEGREYEGQITFKNFVPHGQGKAKYTNNSYYEGQWINGEYHGKGKFVWPDGSQYEGEYQQGKKHGTGTFTYPSKKVYKGQWEFGRQSGLGFLYNQEGQVLKEGLWRNGAYQGPQAEGAPQKLQEGTLERQIERIAQRRGQDVFQKPHDALERPIEQ